MLIFLLFLNSKVCPCITQCRNLPPFTLLLGKLTTSDGSYISLVGKQVRIARIDQ